MSDVLCAGCGSTQRAGAPFCAVCGRAFPRTGRPVETPAGPPQGALQRAHDGAGSVAGPPGQVSLVHTGTTEPEMMTATQVPAYQRPAAPEVEVAPVYAHVGRRIVAFLLDGVVAGVLFGIVYGIGFSTVDLPSSGVITAGDPQFAPLVAQILTVAGLASAAAGLYWLAMLIWEGRTGKTLGNLIMGIRTQRADGGGMPIGVGRAFLRYLVVAACGLVPFFGTLLVQLSPLWDGGGRKQGWQDKAGKAVVVDRRAMQRAAAPRTASFAPASGGPAARPAAPAAQQPVAQPVTQQPVVQPVAQQPVSQPVVQQPVVQQPGQSPASPPPGVHDPYAAPAYQQPASAVGPGSLITGVPGAGAPQPQQVAPQPQQVAPPQQPAPAQPVAHQAPEAPVSEVEEHTSFETRMQSRAQRQELRPAPVVAVELELESGDRHVVDGPARIGRNPEASAGEPVILVRVDDPTRSVSKNHADLDVDSAGLWLNDRGSTNGTVISVAGLPPRVAEPGARVRVPVGATIHVGDRRIVVHPGGRA
ncbi:RDD family protein [Krasilnikoviella flava]|uniref:Forkhead associated (FHA) domain, binds pSer, pThr, pTyr n=1 Tax=Krasilnikoviella flava TaxID=526729 RepID=A0A1T5J877_9MICO|nr:RDD family protein [Krasilnikoviella flava]SKC47650.1 Forkhead associated (FHA) domain, binds pSer, pThr, pTyr [Krasilnikoviella flava]